MSYASEQLHKGYLRRKMAMIVSKVKVREIMIHLPCLTDHDRETIEAKRETNGNFDGMVLLLECLKRREHWPEQLIEALEACEQPTLAAEVRGEYNALRCTSTRSSPSTTVVSAHVHPPPSASQPPVLQGGEKSLANEVSAPPEPVAPLENATRSPAAQLPPESTQTEVAPLPSTPPPSPEAQHTPAGTPVLPRTEVHVHQEPEENSESDIQYLADVIPDPASTGNRKVNAMVTPPRSEADPHRTTAVAEVRPPRSPAQTRSDVPAGSSLLTGTPEKPPVQDTTPPVEKGPAAVQEPQVPASSPQTAAAARPGAAVTDASLFDDDTVCLSKPTQLISIQPQHHGPPTIPTASVPLGPYSGNSERLEMSERAPDTVASAGPPARSDGAPCQENGIALNHNELEENHYESCSQSLETQEVGEHVVHISQEMSILNLDGQRSAPQAQTPNSDTGKEFASAETGPSLNAHSSEKNHPSEQLPDPEDNGASCILTNSAQYILTAAGVVALALLVTWKLKY